MTPRQSRCDWDAPWGRTAGLVPNGNEAGRVTFRQHQTKLWRCAPLLSCPIAPYWAATFRVSPLISSAGWVIRGQVPKRSVRRLQTASTGLDKKLMSSCWPLLLSCAWAAGWPISVPTTNQLELLSAVGATRMMILKIVERHPEMWARLHFTWIIMGSKSQRS